MKLEIVICICLQSNLCRGRTKCSALVCLCPPALPSPALLADNRAIAAGRAQGPCIGGGLNIALCADIRYAADTAIFCVPPAKLGIGYPLYMMGTLVSTGRLRTIFFSPCCCCSEHDRLRTMFPLSWLWSNASVLAGLRSPTNCPHSLHRAAFS